MSGGIGILLGLCLEGQTPFTFCPPAPEHTGAQWHVRSQPNKIGPPPSRGRVL